MLNEFVDYIVLLAENYGYLGIFFMMFLESSFIPFPSEVAMIPAGYLASIGKMNFSIALIVGTFGALLGASLNYILAYSLGEKVILNLLRKYGKYFFLKEEHYIRAEKYFLKHGIITIFLARFIPAVRQLISLPAGAFRINFRKFFIYTGIGAGIWNLLLMIIGYIAGKNKDLINHYSKELMFGGFLFILITGGIYYLFHKIKSNKFLEDKNKKILDNKN